MVIEIKKEYYKNGKLKLERFLQRQQSGRFVQIVLRKRTIIGKKRFLKMGKHEGLSKWYYEDGKIGEERIYKNGLAGGTSKWYFENGR